MASHSTINECIFDLEDHQVNIERDLGIVNNECDLESLIGQPGSLYPENVPLWREYHRQLTLNIELALKVKVKLDEELAKFN